MSSYIPSSSYLALCSPSQSIYGRLDVVGGLILPTAGSFF
ncbi:hypothetical protein MCW_01279 [Cardidatus Bartonella washoeensis 085-0475]|uniref:Uncharacterized protein n=1 Tax=Cardidatus Bartonella washoeensis 085-0475 TaxID=1094564 RepID=J1JHS8_9HYPH|nr:hypothetical protein MCW_01279 [Bartonella washoeensis 085-0475]